MADSQDFSERSFVELSTTAKHTPGTPSRLTTIKKCYAILPQDDKRCFTPIENIKVCKDHFFLSPETKKNGDRFIPKRSNGGVSRQLFDLPENLLASPSDVSDYNEREQNTLIYGDLLEQRLLNINPDDKQHNQELDKDFFNQFSSSTYSRNRRKLSNISNDTPQKRKDSGNNHYTIKRPRVLNFSDKKNKIQFDDQMVNEDEEVKETKILKNIRNMRRIPKTPFKVLDAPGLSDDFYQVANSVTVGYT